MNNINRIRYDRAFHIYPKLVEQATSTPEFHQKLAESAELRANWFENKALLLIKQQLVEQIEKASTKIQNPVERAKAREKLEILLKNVQRMEEASPPPSDFDSLIKGLFKGFDKPFKKIFTRTKEKKAVRDLLLSFFVTDLASTIIEDYLDNYKERSPFAKEKTIEELREYLIKNFFAMALPSIEDKKPLRKATKQIAARLLLSASGLAGFAGSGGENAQGSDTETTETSTTAPEAIPYLQRCDVGPAPDSVLHEINKIHKKIYLLNTQMIQGLKQGNIEKKEMDFYLKEIEKLQTSLKNMKNTTATKFDQITIRIAILAAFLVIMKTISTTILTDPMLFEMIISRLQTAVESIPLEEKVKREILLELCEDMTFAKDALHTALTNGLDVLPSLAPLVLGGIGVGIYAWSVKNKTEKVQKLKKEEAIVFKRSALLKTLFSENGEEFFREAMADLESLPPKWKPVSSDSQIRTNPYLEILEQSPPNNPKEKSLLLKQVKRQDELDRHHDAFSNAKEMHLYGLRQCILEHFEEHPDDKCLQGSLLYRAILKSSIKKLGLTDEHIEELHHFVKTTSDKEKNEVLEHLLHIISANHQATLEEEKQAKVNLNIARGNLGITSSSCGVAIATLAGLAIPFAGPIVASVAIIGGTSAALSNYKTATLLNGASALTRGENTFKHSLEVLISENTPGKKSALLLAGISLAKQREIRALFALNIDHLSAQEIHLYTNPNS